MFRLPRNHGDKVLKFFGVQKWQNSNYHTDTERKAAIDEELRDIAITLC